MTSMTFNPLLTRMAFTIHLLQSRNPSKQSSDQPEYESISRTLSFWEEEEGNEEGVGVMEQRLHVVFPFLSARAKAPAEHRTARARTHANVGELGSVLFICVVMKVTHSARAHPSPVFALIAFIRGSVP